MGILRIIVTASAPATIMIACSSLDCVSIGVIKVVIVRRSNRVSETNSKSGMMDNIHWAIVKCVL